MLKLAGEADNVGQDQETLEAQGMTAIAKCQRKTEAARNLYEDGDLTRDEYLRRKEDNEREIAHWRAYTTEFQQLTLNLLLCINAVGRLAQLWSARDDEDRNWLAQTVFEYVVYDLD